MSRCIPRTPHTVVYQHTIQVYTLTPVHNTHIIQYVRICMYTCEHINRIHAFTHIPTQCYTYTNIGTCTHTHLHAHPSKPATPHSLTHSHTQNSSPCSPHACSHHWLDMTQPETTLQLTWEILPLCVAQNVFGQWLSNTSAQNVLHHLYSRVHTSTSAGIA